MKLLMNVKNITWFKPPELGGVSADVRLSNGFLEEETDEEVLEQLRMDCMVSVNSNSSLKTYTVVQTLRT